MSNLISHLEIENFKSVKTLKLDCKRVNVFIGKPNVGKSNVLEAIGLLNPRMLNKEPVEEKATRFENLVELHYDNDQDNRIIVAIKTSGERIYKLQTIMREEYQKEKRGIYLVYDDVVHTNSQSISSETGDPKMTSPDSNGSNHSSLQYRMEGPAVRRDKESMTTEQARKEFEDLFLIKKYQFKMGILPKNEVLGQSLLSPFGSNIFDIVSGTDSLKQKIVELFRNDYGLQFVFSKVDKKFFVQKLVDGYVYQYPYSSVADTFQRFIFYLSAIESNSNSVLIFEEPEVHSFPPYVKELAERIVNKDDNQYFVSTHSPYLLQTLVEELKDDELNVILTYYKDYQTFVKVLTPSELREVQDYNIDVFFNLNKFEPDA